MIQSISFTGEPVFAQLVGLINKPSFNQLVKQNNADHYCKRCKSWEHFVCMLCSTLMRNSFEGSRKQRTFVLEQNAKVNFYPFKRHLISPAVDHYYNSLVNDRQSNVYVELLYRYTTKRKIDLELW